MHEPPSALLQPEDARDPKRDLGEVIRATNPGPEPLDLHDTREAFHDMPGDGLEADDLTASIPRRRERSPLSYRL